MSATRFDRTTQSPEETAALAKEIGQTLRGGDTILLSGPIGAGKSHFCRHLIQSRLSTPEDVPSPTFTLVQIYEAEDTGQQARGGEPGGTATRRNRQVMG